MPVTQRYTDDVGKVLATVQGVRATYRLTGEELFVRAVANPNLTDGHRKLIAGALDVNNSDVDFCEYRGRTDITYSWGNQQGTEFLAKAVHDGSLANFLKGFFP